MKKKTILIALLAFAATSMFACSTAPQTNTESETTIVATTTENTVESVKAEHYAKADELAAAGKYDEAIEEYKSADDYSDSKEKIFGIYNTQGDQALAREEYDKAIDYYKKASEYKDVSEKILGVYYTQGEKALNAGDFEKAVTFFKDAGSYKDAAERLSEIVYNQAEQALKEKDNKAAAKLFSEAGNYKDALERSQSIYYSLGTAALKKKAYDEAIESFTGAGDYKDAKSKVQAAYFNKGKEFIGKKQYEEAAKVLQSAGDYSAAKKLLETTITTLIKNKNFDEADKMADYCDPTNASNLKNYIQGRKEYADGNYQKAASAFEQANGIKDSSALINESYYLLGIETLKAGNYKEAEEYFLKCDKYKASEALQNVCKGEVSLAEKNYEKASLYYGRVPNKLKINGFNVQARKAIVKRIDSFRVIDGYYTVASNTVSTTQIWKYDKRYKNSWSSKGIVDTQNLDLRFEVNEDGTVDLIGKVTYIHFTNYSSIKSLLEVKIDTSNFRLNNLKSVPTNAVIDNNLRLQYKKGTKVTVVYNEKDNWSDSFYNVYKSVIVFTRMSKTMAERLGYR